MSLYQKEENICLLQESTSGVYARLWERIQSNQEESLCNGDYSYCTNVWSNSRHLVKIGIHFSFNRENIISDFIIS